MIVNRIYEWARIQPHKTALIQNDAVISYAVFARTIDATRKFFEQQNLPTGGTAIVLVEQLSDAWIIVLALRALGLNTISVRSISTAEELKVRDAACVVVTQIEQPKHILKDNAQAWTKLVVVPTALSANVHTGDIPRLADNSPPVGDHIVYTSGTTGYYKKILLLGLVEEDRNFRRSMDYGFNKNTLGHVLDMGLMTGFGYKHPLAIWHVGGGVVFDQRPDAYRRVFSYEPTYIVLIPYTLRNILTHSARTTRSILNLDLGAGVASDWLAQEVIRKFHCNYSVVYASTECGSKLLSSQYECKDDLHWLSPPQGRTIEIVDQNGKECLVGEQGELRARLENIDATSYLDDPEASTRFFRDGYFYPGDIAVRRGDGRIRILGRAGDVVNFEGHKVPVGPLEQEVKEYLSVENVCLFGGLNDQGSVELVVVIEAEKMPRSAQLKYVAAKFKSFERVRFEVLNEFPRTELGYQKIKRTELRKMIFGPARRNGSSRKIFSSSKVLALSKISVRRALNRLRYPLLRND